MTFSNFLSIKGGKKLISCNTLLLKNRKRNDVQYMILHKKRRGVASYVSASVFNNVSIRLALNVMRVQQLV
jgi:hypothetical protein